MLVANLIYRESMKKNSKTERKRLLPVLPLMEKTRRQKVQANLQSIMIIWAKIQENAVFLSLFMKGRPPEVKCSILGTN